MSHPPACDFGAQRPPGSLGPLPQSPPGDDLARSPSASRWRRSHGSPRAIVRHGTFAALLALVAFTVACGARVSDEQVAGLSATEPNTGRLAADDASAADDFPGHDSSDPGAQEVAASGSASSATPGQGQNGGASDGGSVVGNGGATDVGITGDTVLLGNVSTLSGPVPGLFQGAVIGSQAIIAFQNSKGGLFGRKFELTVRDDQFDSGQNRAHTINLMDEVFAFVGSFSLYDGAAAPEIARVGIPDTTYSLTAPRRRLANNFSPSPGPPNGAATSVFNYFKGKSPDGVKAVGTLYIDPSRATHEDYKKAAESVGWRYIYERGISPTETDFTADIVRMRQQGVKVVYLIAVDVNTVARLAKAMAQQGFKPEYFVVQGAAYDPKLFPLAGAAADGLYSAHPYALFAGEDADAIPEVKLFNEWLQRVKPGYKPDLYAALAWSSGRLLFGAMEKAGPKATRADVLRALAATHHFSANDLMAPADPASKRMAECYVLAKVADGKFTRVDSPIPYRCGDGTALVFDG